MQELTVIMLVASLAFGGATFLPKRTDSRVASLALVVSVLAVASAVVDESVASGSAEFLIAVVAPLAVVVYSVAAMLFGSR